MKVVEEFEISFYVDEDGFIPSGQYLYDNSDSKTAFTFDSAFLTGEMTSPDKIVGGTISVSYENSKYSISVNCMLSSGESKNINYNGLMSYVDVPVQQNWNILIPFRLFLYICIYNIVPYRSATIYIWDQKVTLQNIRDLITSNNVTYSI